MESVTILRGKIPSPESGGGDGGDGSGDGSGDGYGYAGDGGDYWIALARAAIQEWCAPEQSRFADLLSTDAVIAFWKSNKEGYSANGGMKTIAAAPGVIEETAGPLEICTENALHATMRPDKWKGERLWIVALFGGVQVDGDKFGARKREIIGEVPLGMWAGPKKWAMVQKHTVRD